MENETAFRFALLHKYSQPTVYDERVLYLSRLLGTRLVHDNDDAYNRFVVEPRLRQKNTERTHTNDERTHTCAARTHARMRDPNERTNARGQQQVFNLERQTYLLIDCSLTLSLNSPLCMLETRAVRINNEMDVGERACVHA